MYPVRGKWEIKFFQKAASTVFTANTLVSESSADNTIIPYFDAAAAVGIVLKSVAATDSDYASLTRIPVAVPLDSSSEFLADTASTIATTDEGELMDIVTSSSGATVNEAATASDIVKLKQFVSTTQGIFTLHKKAFL